VFRTIITHTSEILTLKKPNTAVIRSNFEIDLVVVFSKLQVAVFDSKPINLDPLAVHKNKINIIIITVPIVNDNIIVNIIVCPGRKSVYTYTVFHMLFKFNGLVKKLKKYFFT